MIKFHAMKHRTSVGYMLDDKNKPTRHGKRTKVNNKSELKFGHIKHGHCGVLIKALTVFPDVQRTLMSSLFISTTSPSIQASSGSSSHTRDPTTRLAAEAYKAKSVNVLPLKFIKSYYATQIRYKHQIWYCYSKWALLTVYTHRWLSKWWPRIFNLHESTEK